MLKTGLSKLLRSVTPDKVKIGSCISKTFLSADMSPPIVIQPKGPHKASVIFLHGLGDTGHGWSQVMGEDLNVDSVKFICPTASVIPVTINMGMRMPAWYDITSLSEFDKEDKAGIMRSVSHVHQLISEEEKSVPSDKIFVGGFSQGGAVALYAGLTYNKRLGGIVGLSCYLPLHTEYPTAATPQNSSTPLIMCHGKADVVVDFRFGQMSYQKIKEFHSEVEMKSYDNMGHTSCPRELMDVKNFISKHLADSS